MKEYLYQLATLLLAAMQAVYLLWITFALARYSPGINPKQDPEKPSEMGECPCRQAKKEKIA